MTRTYLPIQRLGEKTGFGPFRISAGLPHRGHYNRLPPGGPAPSNVIARFLVKGTDSLSHG